ncbi:MAG: hypothetical protein KIT02_14440 [Devosia sp.]|uniref:hypothetical protein n=1 Tax=Devosia sp. TaxID=1871048 RepID=UPI0024C8FCC6|nr:hypothetical protein [Devosia sp.]UYN99111.1 MAG: hypothetical protein KIT02_14440 [Devosia sp.]
MPDQTRADLLDFLEYLAKKGLMNPTTARSRKAAASAVLGILSDEEAADLSSLNLDDVMHRFHNLNGTKFTPDSLATYKSRTKSAIDDFLRYKKNPLAFRVATPAGTRAARAKAANNVPDNKQVAAPLPAAIENRSSSPVVDNILPIQIRADLAVYIQGLPFDLTKAEANKIAKVVMAMALEVSE